MLNSVSSECFMGLGLLGKSPLGPLSGTPYSVSYGMDPIDIIS